MTQTVVSSTAPYGSPQKTERPGSAPARSSQRPRILIVESNEDGTVGGSHQALFDLVVGIDQADFEPVVLFYETNKFVGLLGDRGIEVVLFDEFTQRRRETTPARGSVARMLRSGMDVVRCRRALRRLRIDLVHMNNSPSVGNDNWLPAAMSLRIPCIVSAMGNTSRPRRLIHRWLYRKFDLYLAISRYVAGTLLARGVNPSRIELIYLGVDVDNLKRRAARLRDAVLDELGVGRDQILVLMVGNLREWKGQREVVRALRLLPQHVRSRMCFCFAGGTARADTAYEAELRSEVADAGLGDCVKFLGARGDVPDLYAAADIAVHASTMPEPFGLVVPEAMALRCAVIAASAGGPAEIIIPGTGILCDPRRPEEYAQALEQLIVNDALRASIADAAPARAAVFSIERNIQATSRAYRRALQKRAGTWKVNSSATPERVDRGRNSLA